MPRSLRSPDVARNGRSDAGGAAVVCCPTGRAMVPISDVASRQRTADGPVIGRPGTWVDIPTTRGVLKVPGHPIIQVSEAQPVKPYYLKEHVES